MNENGAGLPQNAPFPAASSHEQYPAPFATPSLPDWYSGNVSLYGLLDQDLNGLGDASFGYFGDGTIHNQ